jgi:uncharacterized OsmC-like protein
MKIDFHFDSSGSIIPRFGNRIITMQESPFLIFLASAGMCSAVYIQAFCKQREIPLDLVSVSQRMNYNPLSNRVTAINIIVNLKEGFPMKYEKALKNVVAQCPVKKHLSEPPSFEVFAEVEHLEAGI